MDESLYGLDDPELIAQALHGQEQAFAILIERHYDMIYTVAYKWCGTQADAEDIAQDVCIKLAESLPQFDGRSRFTTWLYRVIINTAKDMFRRRSRRSANTDAFADDPASHDSPVTPEQELRARQLHNAIHQLPDKLRDAVLLVCSEGLSHAEAGAVLQCAETTISWRIHQARKKLAHLNDQEVRYG